MEGILRGFIEEGMKGETKKVKFMSQMGLEVRKPKQVFIPPYIPPQTIHVHHTREVTKTSLQFIPFFT